MKKIKKKTHKFEEQLNNSEKSIERERTEEQGRNEKINIYEKSNKKKILEMYQEYIIVSLAVIYSIVSSRRTEEREDSDKW